MFCSLQKREFGERGVFAIGIGLISSKKGKLYFKFVIAAALLIALASALYTLAANLSASLLTSSSAFLLPNSLDDSYRRKS